MRSSFSGTTAQLVDKKVTTAVFKDRTSDVLRLYLLKIPNVRSSISVLTVFPILLVGLKSESIGAFWRYKSKKKGCLYTLIMYKER